MILTIAFKEFYSNLISARFVIGFLICLFLIPFTMIVSINDYQNQVTGYEIAREKAEKVYDARVYSALRPEIVSPPEPLSIFSRGISYNVGNSVKILLGELPMLASAPGETYNNPFPGEISDNPFMKSFFSIDFISIITIIMSLIALIFTYDAFSHEREMGTLKLALSNPISRSYLILGKAVGVILTLMPIIVFCYVLSSIIILISPYIALSQGEWFRVALLFIMSILYFMVFMFLGLFISSSFKSSATSIVVCLIAWIVFVFIIPNLSSYMSQSLIQVDTEEKLRRSLSDLNSEFNEKYPWPGQMTFVGGNIGSDGYSEVTGSSPETMERTLAYYRNSEPARIGYADKKWVFQKAYFDKLDRQRAFAEKISLLSPSEIFQLMSTALCRTDVQSYEHFFKYGPTVS